MNRIWKVLIVILLVLNIGLNVLALQNFIVISDHMDATLDYVLKLHDVSKSIKTEIALIEESFMKLKKWVAY